MAIQKQIGKNTLGGGQKMTVDLHTYNRSTHDLSYAWRSSLGVGTLVPCMKLVGLPGDTFDIAIDTKVMTHPTVGPLFGSYKMQVDIFTCPFRLYNAQLHNNALNIGMDMSKVKLPNFEMNIKSKDNAKDSTHLTFSSSSILAYLGLRGIGNVAGEANFKFQNAVPLLSYWDIFKCYYANKQEENFKIIRKGNTVYQVEDHLVYNSNRIEGGYFIVKNTYTTTKEDIQVEFKNPYAIFRPYEYLSQFFDITNEQNGLKYTLKDIIINKPYGELTGIARTDEKDALFEVPLSELDDLREDILKSGKAQFTLTKDTNTLANATLGRNTSDDTLYAKGAGAGLLLKTYQSDKFNNWVNTEWIDGENGISEITAISTAGNKFTIDQLNLSKKVYDMLNRIAVSGGTYQDWVETVYTSGWEMHTETPVYEGGMSSEIEFEEVVSTATTDQDVLGTLAGRGRNTNKKGGRLHIKIKEPCYIIGIVSVTPRVDYCQGNDWDMVELKTMDDLHKPALDGIGYQDLLTHEMACWGGYGGSKAIGKQPAWINYMTNFNKTYGTFAEQGNEAFMVLNRYYEPKDGTFDGGKEIDASTYIDPSKYNYIFAETSAESQNFWVQLGFAIEARRMMSAKQIPNL